MPKFFFTHLFLVLLTWLGLLFWLSSTVPDDGINTFVSAVGFFLTIGTTLASLFFLWFNYRLPSFSNKRIIYLRSIKYGFFTSFFVMGLLTLKVFRIANPAVVVLFILLSFMLYSSIKGKRI